MLKYWRTLESLTLNFQETFSAPALWWKCLYLFKGKQTIQLAGGNS